MRSDIRSAMLCDHSLRMSFAFFVRLKVTIPAGRSIFAKTVLDVTRLDKNSSDSWTKRQTKKIRKINQNSMKKQPFDRMSSKHIIIILTEFQLKNSQLPWRRIASYWGREPQRWAASAAAMANFRTQTAQLRPLSSVIPGFFRLIPPPYGSQFNLIFSPFEGHRFQICSKTFWVHSCVSFLVFLSDGFPGTNRQNTVVGGVEMFAFD